MDDWSVKVAAPRSLTYPSLHQIFNMDDLLAAWADEPSSPSNHTHQGAPYQQVFIKSSATRAKDTASTSSENSFASSVVASAGRHIFNKSRQAQRGDRKLARCGPKHHRGRGGYSGGKASPRTYSGSSGSSGDRPILKQSAPNGIHTPPPEIFNQYCESLPNLKHEPTMSVSPRRSPPPANTGSYGRNKTNLRGVRDKEWPLNQEVKIKLTSLPRYISMREIHSALSRFGNVYSIEMQRFQKNTSSWVIFRLVLLKLNAIYCG